MGTVKYSGPVASFHCPTEATIRSLKVHFSPKQLGEGTPSPENIREIVGWDGVKVYNRSQNLIASETEWLPDKWIIDNGKLRHSVYYSFYIPVPKGTFYIHKNKTGLLAYGGLIDRPPEIGDAAYETITLTSYLNRAVNNEGGHPYLLLCGPTSEPNKSLEEWLIENEVWIDLINPSSFMKPYHGSTTNYEFGVLGKNKFPAADGAESDCFLAANTPYVLSATSASEGYFRGYYEDGTNTGIIWINQTRDGDRRSKVITPEKNIIKGFFFVASGMSECQIELGSSATTYEPYNPNKTVYGGWVDLISGEVCEEWLNRIYDGSSDERWALSGTNTYVCAQTDVKNDERNISPLCDKFLMGQTFSASYAIRPIGNNAYASTVAEWREWLAENPIQIVYQLATPNTYRLAPTQLQTFLGQNNVWSNADYVEVEYDLHETQTILARKQFIMANQPHIVKPAAAPLQNFVTDMAAPLKECKVHFGPVQEGIGDPSPDNVRPIAGWTGVEVYRTGKNMFSDSTSDDVLTWIRDGAAYSKDVDGRLPSNQQFTLQANITKDLQQNISNCRLYFNGERISGMFINTATPLGIHTVTNKPTENGRLWITHNHLGISSSNYGATFNNMQLELGNTATEYEPYTGITIPIAFPSEAGTIYGGYVDLVKGEVWKTYNKIVLDGVTTYCKVNSDYSNSTYIIGGVVYLEPAGTYDTTRNSRLFCDTMPILAVNDVATDLPYIRTISAGNQYLRIYLTNTEDYPELDTKQKRIDFVNAYLVEHPITVVYPLKVSQLITTLTPTQLKTLRGTNNIWSTANENIELSYWTH